MLKTATGGALGVIQLNDDPSKLEPSWGCVGSKITTSGLSSITTQMSSRVA
jgi:hypothetical protein